MKTFLQGTSAEKEEEKNLLLLSRPIDFEYLTRQGILEQRGAWYLVKDWDRLPEHARFKAYAARDGGEGLLVKFRK